MPRKPKQEPERRVVNDFSQAVKMDKSVMARLVEIVLKNKLKGHSFEIVLALAIALAVALFIYDYFFR